MYVQKLFTSFSCKLLVCPKCQMLKCDLPTLERCIPPTTITPFRKIMTRLSNNLTNIVDTFGRWLSASSFKSGSSKCLSSMSIVESPFENFSLRLQSTALSTVSSTLHLSKAQSGHSYEHTLSSEH
ncbi:hypothetical protein Fot_42380 [Forsythia ovata]|uniref:Uncharacterized protein n=1 Tax=Forsythia ovata TaxID=205694 RepID=A0ABD1RL17_9LAMI